MKPRSEVTPEKLRGGFYTPDPLVDYCLERVAALLPGRRNLRVLEPSAGDGAFIRGLGRSPALAGRVESLVAIEPLDIEAEKCRKTLEGTRLHGSVLTESAITWAAESSPQAFDAAIGNPPFLRYQFISERDQTAIQRLAAKLGIKFPGVSNLWIPVLLGSLGHLRPGGAFSFVVPTECLTGHAARTVRRWLFGRSAHTRLDLFPPASFPGVLQEIAVLSGTAAEKQERQSTDLSIVEHGADGVATHNVHRVGQADHGWTHVLLDRQQREALEAARAASGVEPLGDVARFEVSIVTGANDFFSVTDSERAKHCLDAWVRPLLPRIRHATGLRYTAQDHQTMLESGARAWLLDFAENRPNPLESCSARKYIAHGEHRGLPDRYKCRIRKPWFRVPNIERGDLLLSKRSHRFPRIVVNDKSAFTTDTIYRGRITANGIEPCDVAASFHNSLTLLTAEIEGRSFGGGVLELVPSEIARLLLPISVNAGIHLGQLDRVARRSSAALIHVSDELLVAAGLLEQDQVRLLRAGWNSLVRRRLDRNEAIRDLPEPIDQQLALVA